MPPPYQPYEIAVLVFFRSRGISHRACLALIRAKFYSDRPCPRTIPGLRTKLRDLTKQGDFPGWQWVSAIDQWIRCLPVSNLDELLTLNEFELGLIGDVRTSVGLYFYLMKLLASTGPPGDLGAGV
jgi:hypothetical protein